MEECEHVDRLRRECGCVWLARRLELELRRRASREDAAQDRERDAPEEHVEAGSDRKGDRGALELGHEDQPDRDHGGQAGKHDHCDGDLLATLARGQRHTGEDQREQREQSGHAEGNVADRREATCQRHRFAVAITAGVAADRVEQGHVDVLLVHRDAVLDRRS